LEKTRNDKSFFYVFPTLKVEEDIQILFADVEVIFFMCIYSAVT